MRRPDIDRILAEGADRVAEAVRRLDLPGLRARLSRRWDSIAGHPEIERQRARAAALAGAVGRHPLVRRVAGRIQTAFRERGVEGSASKAAKAVFVGATVLSILLFGAVEVWPLTLIAVLFSGLAALSSALLGEPEATRPAYRLALFTGLAVTILAVIQGIGFHGNPLAHPVWAEAERLIGPLPAAVSVSPAVSYASLFWALTPLAAFVAALALFAEEHSALRLLSVLGWIAGFAAVYAILEATVAPERLLLQPKTAYVGSLTAPFVNRNTAATFYGLGSLVLAAFVFGDKRRRHETRQDAGARSGSGRVQRWWRKARRPLRAFLLAAAVVALMMTNSRGGIAAALVGFLVLLPAIIGGPDEREGKVAALMQRYGRPAGAVVAVFALVLVFAGGAGQRFAEAGLDDQRFCMIPALLSSILDAPVLGSGMGTFSDSFAAYRDPACGVWGIWYRAHDSYIEAAIALGVPVMLLLVAAAAATAAELFRGVKARSSRRFAPAVGLAAIALVAFHALVDFSIQIPGIAVFCAALVAAALTVGRSPAHQSATGGRKSIPTPKSLGEG